MAHSSFYLNSHESIMQEKWSIKYNQEVGDVLSSKGFFHIGIQENFYKYVKK